MDPVAAGHELAGRYVVDQQLGMGGSGQVWKAHDTVLDRPVAVKVVPDGTAAARLAREARATAGIGVPNVVGVYDVGEQDGAHFLVMEYVEGVDLAVLLRTTGAFEPDVAALVGRDVARGLAAVHGAELVHRDVTPANVMVTTEGQVKLTDLGIARRTDGDATRQLTQPGTVVGTVDYLAPEQVEGGEDVSAASDVYAAGLLLHTTLTGRAPFGDGPMSERVARRLAGGPEPLGEEVGALAEVVAVAVQQDPQERPADGRALLEVLAGLVPDDEEPLRQRLAGRVATARAAGPAAAGDTTDAVEGMAIPMRPARRTADDASSPSARPAEASTPAARHQDATATTELASVRGAEPDEVSPATDDEGQGRPVLRPMAVAVAGVVVVVGVVSALLAAGGGDGDGGDGSGGDGGDGGSQVQPLAIAAVDDHDPLGGGGEHGDEIGRVADGDAATAWDTEGYESPDLGGLKDGVGFLVNLGEAREVAAVEVDLGLDGVDVTVTVSDERPGGDPTTEATILGSASEAGGTARIEGEPVTGTWVTVWFTSLADDGARFRAEVAEVRVFGP